MEKLILIDGTGLIFRGFYAIPPYFKNKEGVQTNAVFGFTSIVLSILEQYKPTHMGIAFDVRGKTFRHEAYKDYKATRTAAPDELYAQIPMCKEIVDAFGIPKFELSGFEADDVIATISKKIAPRDGLHTLIATGDFDLFQLVTPKASILYPTKGFRGADIMDSSKIYEKYGIYPEQVCDYKSLAGDSSDNIPGVRGIGPKGAKALIDKYKTLEAVYENLAEITGTTNRKLTESKANAFLSKQLCTLDYEVPIDFDIEACRVHKFNAERVYKDFEELNFNSLLRRLETLYPEVLGAGSGGAAAGNTKQKMPAPQEDRQASLF